MNTNGNGHEAANTWESMDYAAKKKTYESVMELFRDSDRDYAKAQIAYQRMRFKTWMYHNWKTTAMIGAGLILLTARQFNTVPDRFFATGQYEIRKVDDLFGSTYHLYETQRASTGKFTEEISKDEEVMTRDVSEHPDASQPSGRTLVWGTPHAITRHTIIKPREEIFEDQTTDLGQSKVFNDLTSMIGNWHVR